MQVYKHYDNDTGLYGFKNEAGDIIITPAFEMAEGFSNGVAAVNDGNAWGLIDSNGVLLIPFEYSVIYDAKDGWVQAKKDGIDFLFSTDGKLHLQLTDILYWYVPYKEMIRAKKTTGWGYCNLQGEMIIPFTYQSLGPCTVHGLISFYASNQWGWLNTNGQIIVNPSFSQVGVWNDTLWWGKKNGYYQLYNVQGELVLDKSWQKIEPPLNNKVVVKTSLGWQYITADTFEVLLSISVNYDWVEHFYSNFAAVKSNGLWGFINQHGELIIPAVYVAVGCFSEGLVAVRHKGLWGFIDANNQLVIPHVFTAATGFKNGKAYVENNWASWYINKKGEAVTDIIVLDE